MNNQPPIVDGRQPSDEEKSLKSFFNELMIGQVTFLDEANKRIIELVTGLLAVLFAVIAFGKDFPPPYMQDTFPKVIAIAVMGIFLVSMLLALIGVQPKVYDKYDHNLTEMRVELEKIVKYKSKLFSWASWSFFAGCLLLAGLIIIIIL